MYCPKHRQQCHSPDNCRVKMMCKEDKPKMIIDPGLVKALNDAGYVIVPKEPTPEMWGELARDIVMWDRFPDHSGASLHRHLKSIGRIIPEWLAAEIPDTNRVPPKGTVAVCIYKAMLAAAKLEPVD